MNLVAFGWGLKNLKKEDVILVSDAEHHSNIVPWQEVAKKTGAKLELFSASQAVDGDILPFLKEKMNDRVKIISLPHASNVTGAIVDLKSVAKEAKKVIEKSVKHELYANKLLVNALSENMELKALKAQP